jgi:hypothetical protein
MTQKNNNQYTESAKQKKRIQRIHSKKGTLDKLNEIEKDLQTLLDADFNVEYKKIIISIVMDLKDYVLKSAEKNRN